MYAIIAIQQGVQGDAVPLPGCGVSPRFPAYPAEGGARGKQGVQGDAVPLPGCGVSRFPAYPAEGGAREWKAE